MPLLKDLRAWEISSIAVGVSVSLLGTVWKAELCLGTLQGLFDP
jgi:hypothetical protein